MLEQPNIPVGAAGVIGLNIAHPWTITVSSEAAGGKEGEQVHFVSSGGVNRVISSLMVARPQYRVAMGVIPAEHANQALKQQRLPARQACMALVLAKTSHVPGPLVLIAQNFIGILQLSEAFLSFLQTILIFVCTCICLKSVWRQTSSEQGFQ